MSLRAARRVRAGPCLTKAESSGREAQYASRFQMLSVTQWLSIEEMLPRPRDPPSRQCPRRHRADEQIQSDLSFLTRLQLCPDSCEGGRPSAGDGGEQCARRGHLNTRRICGSEPEPDDRSAHTDDRGDADKPQRPLPPSNSLKAHITSPRHRFHGPTTPRRSRSQIPLTRDLGPRLALRRTRAETDRGSQHLVFHVKHELAERPSPRRDRYVRVESTLTREWSGDKTPRSAESGASVLSAVPERGVIVVGGGGYSGADHRHT